MPSAPISFPPPRGTKPGPFSGEGRNRTPRRPPRRRRRTQNGLEKSGNRIQRHLQPSEAPPSPPRGTKPLPRKRVERTDPRPTPQAAETVCGELRRCNMLPVPDSAHPPGIPVLRPRPESGRQKPSAEKAFPHAAPKTAPAVRHGRHAPQPGTEDCRRRILPRPPFRKKRHPGKTAPETLRRPNVTDRSPLCPGRSPGAACGLGIPAESAAAERYRFGV